tara:strand:- start:880 stop:1071 length:192 start_codon:yes stop_codon:yes gene_type:complete
MTKNRWGKWKKKGYIKDMLGEHSYRIDDILVNDNGHEVRDLDGMAITISSKHKNNYKDFNDKL